MRHEFVASVIAGSFLAAMSVCLDVRRTEAAINMNAGSWGPYSVNQRCADDTHTCQLCGGVDGSKIYHSAGCSNTGQGKKCTTSTGMKCQLSTGAPDDVDCGQRLLFTSTDCSGTGVPTGGDCPDLKGCHEEVM